MPGFPFRVTVVSEFLFTCNRTQLLWTKGDRAGAETGVLIIIEAALSTAATVSLRFILASKDPMRRVKERTIVRASVVSTVRSGTSSSPVSASSNLCTRGSLRGAGSVGVSDAVDAL